jgi:hypothetical protein
VREVLLGRRDRVRVEGGGRLSGIAYARQLQRDYTIAFRPPSELAFCFSIHLVAGTECNEIPGNNIPDSASLHPG